MLTPAEDRNYIISAIKEWVSPILIGIIGMLVWRDLSELRVDVRLLLTTQSADKVRISNLESDVLVLKQAVFKISSPTLILPMQPQQYEQPQSPQTSEERR